MKIQWVKSYYECDQIQALANALIGKNLYSYVWSVRLNERKDVDLFFRRSFWLDVILAWGKYKKMPDTVEQVKHESI